MHWERHRPVGVSIGVSVLLHILLLLWSYLSLPEQEKTMFRVRFVSPMRMLSSRPFRVSGFKPAGPEVKMKMLRRGGGPAYVPEIAFPAAALGHLEIDTEMMLMPKEDTLGLQLGSKPAEMQIAHWEMIPIEELRVPREETLDLTRDLLTLGDLERSKRFKAMVVIDPKEKQNVQGYVRIPLRERWNSWQAFDIPRIHGSFATYMSRHTGIKVSIDGSVDLRSPELLRIPILFLGADSLKTIKGVDKQDVEFLGDYILKGGFIVIHKLKVYNQLMAYLNRAYGSRFSPFVPPSDHPIFHSFYDLEWGFMGVGFEGRLVGLAPMPAPTDNPIVRKRWINLIVFAMTQPGGLTYTMFREPEKTSHMALIWRTLSEELDPRRFSVSIDGGKSISLENFYEALRYDGIILHNLASGKHKIRLRYGERTIDREVLLRGGKVTTFELGLRRIFWVTKLYLTQSTEDEDYDEWQARLTDLTISTSSKLLFAFFSQVPSSE